MVQKKENNFYISVLAVLSSIAVVYLHTNGVFWEFSSERYWFSANFIECLCYFAVPVFFMIPGATLLEFYDRYDLKTFFKKRVMKTLIPYLSWSLIALCIQLLTHQLSFSELTPLFLIQGFLTGSLCPIYWFFPYLFLVYICIPLFAAVSKNKKRTVFSFLAVACFIINILIPFLLSVLRIDWQFPYVVGVGSGFLFYVIIGYLFHTCDLTRSFRIVIYILGAVGFLLHFFGTWFASVPINEVSQLFKGYTNLPCVLYSLAIFVLVKTLVQKRSVRTDKPATLERLILFLKKYTLEIYLIHIYFFNLLLAVTGWDDRSIILRLFSPPFLIALCILVTIILRKIPVIRHIVPE